jgi:hypothetical protein
MRRSYPAPSMATKFCCTPLCRADWFEDDLAIPAFLQRTLKEEN